MSSVNPDTSTSRTCTAGRFQYANPRQAAIATAATPRVTSEARRRPARINAPRDGGNGADGGNGGDGGNGLTQRNGETEGEPPLLRFPVSPCEYGYLRLRRSPRAQP